MGHRLFVAVPLPPQLAEQLSRYAESAAPPDARRPPAENLHVTVHFLGPVDTPPETVAGALCDACAELAPFDLRVTGPAWAPQRRPRMLWAELEPDPAFADAGEAAARALAPFAPAAPPRRPGRPHVTLARLRDRPPGTPPPPLELDDPIVHVDALALVESKLSPRGATYVTVASAPLGRT
jgi:RNA 2',3'-cyclic 3'-phosphodiesterase